MPFRKKPNFAVLEIELYHIILLCLAAFAAGFVDAIVGGGGLIQTPAALVVLNTYNVATVIGSLKIPAFSGTALAASQYLRKVSLNWILISIMCPLAFFSSYAGSELLSRTSNEFMKPVIFGVMVCVYLYTIFKKDFGQHKEKNISVLRTRLLAVALSVVVGFYDGFIGPGTGVLFVLAFVGILGQDFLQASGTAKMVNAATNLGSVTLFVFKGIIIWKIAIPMAVANAAGAFLGSRLAIAKGNRFIRIFFLFVVTLTLLRFGFDIFIKNGA